MLWKRILSGSLLVAMLLVVMAIDGWLDSQRFAAGPLSILLPEGDRLPRGIILLAVLLIVLVPLTREFAWLMRTRGSRVSWGFAYACSAIGAAYLYFWPQGPNGQGGSTPLAGLLAGVLFLSLIQPLRRGEREGALMSAAAAMLCIVYLGLMPGFLLAIRWWHPAWTIVALILIIKACDIGAYFAGRWFGRTPLIPLISPKKTVEGLVGGLLFSAMVAVTLAAISNATGVSGHWITNQPVPEFVAYNYPLPLAAIAGAFLGLVGQFGDLVASLFKRDAHVKDSGSSVPGFGGMLDVVDSLLLAAPAGYAILRFTAWYLSPSSQLAGF
ncbi:phosphatidate cytidylyltransferase [Mucisphaera sp.]|uniref:phosphatidate cytidylyltransferase n=1 Tax=Mucisphaera sp. TaxID=2913024 RepID=UPI003D0C4355